MIERYNQGLDVVSEGEMKEQPFSFHFQLLKILIIDEK